MATDFIFADDSRQKSPSRKGMGSLVALGGLHVPADELSALEKSLQSICEKTGFPRDEQFKWSPKKNSFQRKKLDSDARMIFFREVLEAASRHHVRALVVVEDVKYKKARQDSVDHEHDVTALFLERANNCFAAAKKQGIVIIAKPGGGGKDENRFLKSCMDLLESGTSYVNFSRIAIPVATMPSRDVRILQLADLIVSSTAARIGGESSYSPEMFELVKPLFRKEGGRIGGAGLKIHPDFKYANLYYWLLGDAVLIKGEERHDLPIAGRPFYRSSGEAEN